MGKERINSSKEATYVSLLAKEIKLLRSFLVECDAKVSRSICESYIANGRVGIDKKFGKSFNKDLGIENAFDHIRQYAVDYDKYHSLLRTLGKTPRRVVEVNKKIDKKKLLLIPTERKEGEDKVMDNFISGEIIGLKRKIALTHKRIAKMNAKLEQLYRVADYIHSC